MTHDAEFRNECVVIDTMGAPGPSIHTPPMLARLDELAHAGVAAELAVDEMELMGDQELLRGALTGYWEAWDASGVDVASVTLGAFGESGSFTYANAIRDLARWDLKFDKVDRFVKVTKAADAERAHVEHKTGVILNFQNTTHFGDDLGKLEEFYNLGIRIIQLTYNSRNLVGDGCMESDPGGLSSFGIEVVKRMNDLGILVDVSHCSEPTQLDAARFSERPIAITHGFSKAVSEHDRAASDDVIRAVGERGYVGIVLVPFFLSADPVVTLEHFLQHVDHIAGLIGVEHIGIGTDWAPPVPPRLQEMLAVAVAGIGFRPEHRVDWSATIKELDRWEDWPNITHALLEHGYSADEVRGIIGGNFLRVFREVVG